MTTKRRLHSVLFLFSYSILFCLVRVCCEVHPNLFFIEYLADYYTQNLRIIFQDHFTKNKTKLFQKISKKILNHLFRTSSVLGRVIIFYLKIFRVGQLVSSVDVFHLHNKKSTPNWEWISYCSVVLWT